MEMKQLEAFCMAAEKKSFSEAANVLCLTQPTISSHIKALEEEFGCRLFERSHRHVVLTGEGNRLYPYARRIVDLKAEAMQEMNAPLMQTVTIGASTIPSGYLLPGVMADYRARHANVYFNIRQSDSATVETLVLDGLVDFGIIGRKCASSRLKAKELCTDTLVLAMPPLPHYREIARKENPDEIIRTEPVIMREPGSGTLKAFDHYLEEKNIDPARLNVCARNNDLEAIRRMITGGMGVSVLSCLSVRDMEERGQLITMNLHSSRRRVFYLIRPQQASCPPQTEDFIRYLEKSCQNIAGS